MTFHIIISHIFPENFNLQFDHPQEGLRQLAYSACGTFTKKKKRIQKFKETRDSQYIYQNEVNKACFQHDMAYGDFKDLNRRTASNKTLRDEGLNIGKTLKYSGYQRSLASMVYKCFDKKTAGGAAKNENMSNKELAEELHKPIIRKFKKGKVYSSFINNTWGYMQLISKFNKNIRFSLCY